MTELTSRQKEILARVIESYIQTSYPIGSKLLVERYEMNLSAASLRHEMGILEEQGYLTHPHTSAGRVPTDKGYRFYVKEAVREEPVPEEVLQRMSREMESKIENLDGLITRVSLILSAIAEEAVLVTSPRLRELCLKELSLFAFDQTHILAVWCSTSGLVQNCLIEMEEPISVEEVDRVRNFINQELSGAPIASLEEELLRRVESRRDSLKHLYELTLRIVQESLPSWGLPRLFVEGSRYILNQPEFRDFKKFQPLIATLEEKSSLINLLTQQESPQGVNVAIGEKAFSRQMWDCSLVSASYLWQGKRVGAIGVLGPRRMPYGRIMGLVHQMAEAINRAMSKWGSS